MKFYRFEVKKKQMYWIFLNSTPNPNAGRNFKVYKVNLDLFSSAEKLKWLLMISQIWNTEQKAVCLVKIIGVANDSTSVYDVLTPGPLKSFKLRFLGKTTGWSWH